MPTPLGSQFAQLTKTIFAAKGIKLPGNWTNMGDQFNDAFTPSELTTGPNPPLTLFKEVSLNKYHVDVASEIGKKFEAYIDGICTAICDAIGKWMKMAMFAGVQITAKCAIGKPGCFTGPGLNPLISASAPMRTPQEQKYSNAIAAGFDQAWGTWQSQVTIPGLPWYPTFAEFPGPVAPPTPNVPIPLIALPSAGETALSPASLKMCIENNFGDNTALHASDLFGAIAQAFAAIFLEFKNTTVVSNVMGKGPVPTFSPPAVQAGPVVGGDVLPIPGVLV